MKPLVNIVLAVCGSCYISLLKAGEADIMAVKVNCNASCDFTVTVRHEDQGWEHYADKWDLLTPDGEVLATRTLYHPHEHEQPFTRSLNNVTIPDSLSNVIIRAHDSVHHYGGKEMSIAIPRHN